VVIDPIRGDDGEIIGFAKITRDVSERVAAQKELEVAREAFFQSQKMESIGKLTGGIAHDFNNLLMAVLSSLEMLRKRMPDDPKLTQLVDNAVQGAERGAALTQRMLAFARRQDLKPAPTDTPALLDGLLNLLQRTLGPLVALVTKVKGPVRLAGAAPEPAPVASAPVEAASRRSLTVLAVDDDALVLMNTTAMLEELEHTALEATSGAAALEMARTVPAIDLVITDYAMPRMTGRDLVIALRALRPGLPVILATGHADLPPGQAVDARRLPKPFSQNDLARAIGEAMPRKVSVES
jgi:CheY-like chemotaxis protein